jgi:hypothetical protein
VRKALWVIVILGVLIVLDVVLANTPGPAPTSQAISNVEDSASFRRVVGNGTFSYYEYSDNPSWDVRCGPRSLLGLLHPIDPFHEYTTATLIFSVQPSYRSNQTVIPFPFLLLVQVNPSSGKIYSIQTEPSICA